MISIVIPARNEEENISELLESIEEDDFEDYEIIVVDGDSSDRTVEVAKEYGAKVIEGPLQGTSAARNKGWKASEGDIIYFLDADSVLPNGTLEKIETKFEDSSVEIINTSLTRVAETPVNYTIDIENNTGINDLLLGKVILKVINILT